MSDMQHADVRIVPATFDDLPGIAECELLAFSGAFPPEDTFARLLTPFRAPLVRAGVHPRHWPDYGSTIRERGNNLRNGSMIFVAKAKSGEGDGREVVVGVAKMVPPKEVVERFRRNRNWKEHVLNDIVYPTINNVRSKLWKDSDGMDTRFLSVFKKEQNAARDRLDKERRYFHISVFFVHPAFQKRGIGSALLAHCTSVADIHRIPIILESSPVGHGLYLKHGFEDVDVIEFSYSKERIRMPCMIRQPVAPPLPPKDGDRIGDSGSDDDLYVDANP